MRSSLAAGVLCGVMLMRAAVACAQQKFPLEPDCPPGQQVVPDTVSGYIVLNGGSINLDKVPAIRDRIAAALKYAEVIREHYRNPSVWEPLPTIAVHPFVGVMAFAGTARECEASFAVWCGSVALIPNKHGGIDSYYLRHKPLSVSLADALMAAVDSAVRTQAFASLPRSELTDTVVVRVGGVDALEPGDLPLATARFTIFRGAKPVDVGSQPNPAMPSALLMRSYGLTSMDQHFMFIVGSDGKIVPGTLWAMGSPFRSVLDVGRKVLLASSFKPAKLHDCSVPAFAEQRLVWKTE